MRSRIFLFALPFLAAASLFTFCTKEPAVESSLEPTQTVIKVDPTTDRGPCTVTISPTNGAVDVCGTQTNATICAVIGGVNVVGTATILNGGSATYTLTVPTTITLTRNGSLPSSANMTVKVVASGSPFGQVFQMPAQAGVPVAISGSCTL